MFYVYEWFIVATGEVIYVGKGTKNRYKNKKKNKFLNRLLKTEKCDVRIIAYYATEEEAFEKERKRINDLKRIGQAICNKCVYSTGGKAAIWTEERRKSQSDNNPMKRKEQRQRMSEQNPMKQKDVAERVGKAHRKAIFIGNKVFEWAQAASEEFNVSKATIFAWAKNGITSSGIECGYVKEEKQFISINPTKETFAHSIIYDGQEFLSTREAAIYAGVKSCSTILRWCKKGFSPAGISCRFKDDLNEYIYQPPNKAHTCKPVFVNGKQYKSIVEASRDTGLSDYIIRKYYLKNKQDNQQPSQGNFDNSTLEGSTTRD